MAAVREVAERARPDVALANHLVMGPAILARALDGRALRGQDPRQRARVHGQAPPALPAVRARGAGGRPRHPRRLAPHGGEPVGGDGRPDGPRPHPARSAGRRRHPLHARASRTRPAPASKACARAWRPPTRRHVERGLVRPRRRRGGRGARDRRARRPAGRLRRQADRVEGRRPAARGLAARAGPRAATRGCWSSASAPTGRGSSGCAAALAAGDLDGGARGCAGETGGALPAPARLPRRRRRRLPRARRRG